MTPTPNTTLYATVVKLVVTQDRPPFAPKARTIKWRVSKFWLGCDSGWNTCQHNRRIRGGIRKLPGAFDYACLVNHFVARDERHAISLGGSNDHSVVHLWNIDQRNQGTSTV